MPKPVTTFDFAKPIRMDDPAKPITAAEFKVHIENLLELRKRDYSEIMELFRRVGRLDSGLTDVMLIFEPLLVEYQRTHGPHLLTREEETVRARSSVPPIRGGKFG